MTDKTRLPPLNALRVLEALHQTGSVVGAARKLNVSHSAISHQIKNLESWATQPLFERHGRVTLLTEAGQSLAGVTHEAFDSIRHEMDRLPLRGLRSITLASLPLVATEWLMPHLRGFLQRHPETNLHLSMAHTDHPVTPIPDIEIRFGKHSQLMPDDIVLFSGTAFPACSPGLLEEYAGDIDRLLSKGPLVYDEDLRMWSHWLEVAGMERHADGVKSGLLVEGSAMLKAAAITGHGVALCRKTFMGADLVAGRLVQLSLIGIDDDWCYFMRCSDSSRYERAATELAEYLVHCTR